MGLGAAAAMARGDPSADYGSIPAVVLFVALMCVCIIVGHLLEANRWMNESITALFIVSPTAPLFAFALLCVGILVLRCCLLGIEGNCGLFDACGLQGLGTGVVILVASGGKHSRVLM
jgi:ABC-type dipeptide/oligopeptide/nickel transport system permease component